MLSTTDVFSEIMQKVFKAKKVCDLDKGKDELE